MHLTMDVWTTVNRIRNNSLLLGQSGGDKCHTVDPVHQFVRKEETAGSRIAPSEIFANPARPMRPPKRESLPLLHASSYVRFSNLGHDSFLTGGYVTAIFRSLFGSRGVLGLHEFDDF
jgi:hypothetical protein